MTDDEKRFLRLCKERFNYVLMAYKSKDKSYRHPDDVNPDEFVKCQIPKQPMTLKEMKAKYK